MTLVKKNCEMKNEGSFFFKVATILLINTLLWFAWSFMLLGNVNVNLRWPPNDISHLLDMLTMKWLHVLIIITVPLSIFFLVKGKQRLSLLFGIAPIALFFLVFLISRIL